MSEVTISSIMISLEETKIILKWLIEGQFIHGLPISSLKWITKDWIIQNYNVDETYFKLCQK